MLTFKGVSRSRAITNDYNIVDLCIVTITDVYKNVKNAFVAIYMIMTHKLQLPTEVNIKLQHSCIYN